MKSDDFNQAIYPPPDRVEAETQTSDDENMRNEDLNLRSTVTHAKSKKN